MFVSSLRFNLIKLKSIYLVEDSDLNEEVNKNDVYLKLSFARDTACM